jgi:hypothetical protein
MPLLSWRILSGRSIVRYRLFHKTDTVYLDKTVPTILAKNGPNHLMLSNARAGVEAALLFSGNNQEISRVGGTGPRFDLCIITARLNPHYRKKHS